VTSASSPAATTRSATSRAHMAPRRCQTLEWCGGLGAAFCSRRRAAHTRLTGRPCSGSGRCRQELTELALVAVEYLCVPDGSPRSRCT
jgi:hypothetical protein